MKRLLAVTSLVLLLTTGLAHAGYTPTGSTDEVTTLEIFQNIFGSGMSGDNWCGAVYTDGTITATRVQDHMDPYSPPGAPGDDLYLL